MYVTDAEQPLLGISKWLSEHKQLYPDEDELRGECERYMAEFDERERLKHLREKKMTETPDEVC